MKWWVADLGAARCSQVIALALLLIQAGLQLAGGLERVPWIYRLLGLSREGIAAGEAWQLASHALLHGGWVHAALNVTLLMTAGSRIERISGGGELMKVFAAGAIGGGLFFLLFPPPAPGIPLVGASGAVFALILWLTTASPDSRMWPVPVSARNLGLGLLLASGGLAIATPWLAGGEFPVAHSCHFGGALAGWLMARRHLRSPVDLQQLQKERARREAADGPGESR